MPELSEMQAIVLYWASITLLLGILGYGLIEALGRWFINRYVLRKLLETPHEVTREIETKRELEHSRYFMLAFALSVSAIVVSALNRFLNDALPPPDTSVPTAVVLFLLDGAFVCFWLSKHAHAKADRDVERYLEEHPEERSPEKP